MTFLETLTDLPDPVGSDPLASSSGKQQTAYVKDVTDAVEDIRGVLAGPVWRSVKAFLPVPTSVLDSGDAATNWVGVSLNSAIAADTTVKATGTASIKIALRGDVAASKGYLNVPGAPATAGKVRLVFTLRWSDDGAKVSPADFAEFFISSAASIGGTVTAFPIPYLGSDNFLSLTVPISSIATLGSFGIRHKGAAFLVPGSTPTLNVWIDSVRWEATELDVALASANAVAVPADYVSAVPQNPVTIPATKTVLDLRAGSARISRADGSRYGTEFGLFPGTAVDITALLNYIIGQTEGELTLAPGQYIMNGEVDFFRLSDRKLNLYGVTLYRTIQNSPVGWFVARTARRIGIFGGYCVGFHTNVSNGTSLVSVASNRLSAQQSDRDDGTVFAEPYLWTQLANSALSADTKNSKRPKGVSTEIRNTLVGGTATVGMALPTGASAPYDVEPSTSYTAFGSIRAHDQPASFMPWAARLGEIAVKWYTAGGASAGADSVLSALETDQNTWKLITGAVTSPATAAKASLEVRILGVAGGDTSNSSAVATTLNGGITSGALTITVANGAGLAAAPPTAPFTLHIEGEQILIASVVGNVLNVDPAGRGYGGTTAAAHLTNAQVLRLLGEDHNVDLFGLQRTTARTLGTSGTSVLLANPGDEARVATARVYARDKDFQVKCDFVLSDTAGVAGDVELLARDDETLEVLASRFVTLTARTGTATQTEQLVYTQNNWVDQYNEHARLVRFSVRKIKATANTIAFASVTEYGRPVYDGNLESNSGLAVSDTDPDSNEITIEDTWFEGLGGCAVKFTSGANNCAGRRLVSRGGQFQGFALTGGSDNWFDDCVDYGCGRSAFDIEPPAANRIVRRGGLRNCKSFRPTNAGLAWSSFGRTEDVTIDGFYVWKQGVQSNVGGKWSRVTNVESSQPRSSPTSKDFSLQGLDSTFDGIIAEYGIEMSNAPQSWVDDNGNLASSPSAGNKLANWTLRTGGGGLAILGDNYVIPTSSRGAVVAATPGVSSFVVPIPLQTDLTYIVLVELGWHATPKITARTTSSFTVVTSVPVPVGGSSFNWVTAGV